MMGGLDTALVALPEGNLRQYLHSLEKLRALQPRLIYPAHGPAFDNPSVAIERYIAHRRQRLAQVANALEDGERTADELIDRIYGASLDPQLRTYAASAIAAYLEYMQTEGRARTSAAGMWSLN